MRPTDTPPLSLGVYLLTELELRRGRSVFLGLPLRNAPECVQSSRVAVSTQSENTQRRRAAMRKLLLIGLVVAAPMLIAPTSASAWGWGGLGLGSRLRFTATTAMRPATITATPRRATTATTTRRACASTDRASTAGADGATAGGPGADGVAGSVQPNPGRRRLAAATQIVAAVQAEQGHTVSPMLPSTQCVGATLRVATPARMRVQCGPAAPPGAFSPVTPLQCSVAGG